MTTILRITTVAVLGAAACSTAWAAGPLEEWEMTAKMGSGAQGMPEQKMLVCQKKQETARPPLQSNCKYTSLSGTPSRGSFVMECTGEHPSTIKGEGSQTATTMEGTMTIITGGVEVKQTYTGRLTGTCSVEGSKMLGSPGYPGANAAAMFDPRNRPSRAGSPVPVPGNADPTQATPNGPPPAVDPASVEDKPKSAAEKAKKALKNLLPF